MTGYETILSGVLDRLQASPPIVVGGNDSIRRAHRTEVPRGRAPAVYLIDGPDMPRERGSQCPGREGEFVISLFGRSDTGISVLDDVKRDVMTRLENGWPVGVTVRPGAINHMPEVADLDAQRVDMQFKFTYETSGIWSLDLPE